MKDGVPSTDANMLDPETMTQFLQELKAQQMSLFKSRIKTLFPSGCTKEEEAWKSELLLEVEQALDEKAKWIAERNSNAYTQATWKLVATPVVTLPVCMSVLSLPHLLLYGAVGIAGAWHLNFRAGDEGVKGERLHEQSFPFVSAYLRFTFTFAFFIKVVVFCPPRPPRTCSGSPDARKKFEGHASTSPQVGSLRRFWRGWARTSRSFVGNDTWT